MDNGKRDKRSPNHKSLLLFEQLGMPAAITERKRGPVSQDTFGVFDGVAVGVRQVYWQATSRSNLASRRRKVEESEIFPVLIDAPETYEMWVLGWKDSRARVLSCRAGVWEDCEYVLETP